jgi:hypothetical protein
MESKDAVHYLKEKVRFYESKISKIIAQMDALQAELNRTESLLNSASILLKDELSKDKVSGSLSVEQQPLSARIPLLSLTDAITEIVNSGTGPIHADQILKILREAGKLPRAKNPKNSVVSLLHRGVKSGLYDKVGPNLFAPIRERMKDGS